MKYLLSIIVVAALLVSSCARQNFPDEVDSGSFVLLNNGGPIFVFSANSYLSDENEILLQLSMELLHSNLVFISRNGEPLAEIELVYEVFDKYSRDSQIVLTEMESNQIYGNPERTIQDFERTVFNRFFEIGPGTYEVQVTIKDSNSDKSVIQKDEVIIPGADPDQLSVSSISVIAEDTDLEDSSRFNLATYDIGADIKQLKFNVLMTRPEGDDPVYAHMRILEFKSDLEPARILTAPNLPGNSLVSRGIHYSRSEVVTYQQRRFDLEYGSVEVDFDVPTPPEGTYRYEFFLTRSSDSDAGDSFVYKGRDFAIRSESYPNIGTARELAAPLVYLMNRNEHEEMMAITSDDSLRTAVELFWLENVGSADIAREVMSLYYQRVVEANMQFSTFKEGWKTDMGMIYILFGPPWYVSYDLTRTSWQYGYGYSTFAPLFVFNRTRRGSSRFPFDTWILRRNISLHQVHYSRVQEWLSGHVLEGPFPY